MFACSVHSSDRETNLSMRHTFVDHKHNLTLAGEEKAAFLFLV